MGKLTALRVKAASAPGRYADGDGLFLEVSESGSRRWMLRVQANGRRRDIGLGSLKGVSLAAARGVAATMR
ncbi:Arm DNA-binding domain-containing protein [Allosphingosinicella deserti]|uniref:Arm DNA-binding domain-containing protein n=1 Tax=Allosphingosinicella deserti TaxID=2116704 RepID=UPI002FCE63CF